MSRVTSILRRAIDSIARSQRAKFNQHFCETLEPRRYLASIMPSFNDDSVPQQVKYHFIEDVSGSLTTADQSLINLTSNQVFDSSQSHLSYDASTDTASFTYPAAVGTGGWKSGGIAGSLPDGNYESTLDGDSVVDSYGNGLGDDAEQQFFFLAGDVNHDRVVDDADTDIVIDNWGSFQTGATFSDGDTNYNGSVEIADLDLITSEYGVQLPVAPDQPNELTATAATDDPSHKIALNWLPPSNTDIDGFRIWRSTNGTNFTQVMQITNPSITNWTDTGLSDGTKYTYRVRGYSTTAGDSPSTNKASAVTVLKGPTDFAAQAMLDGTVKLTWTNNSQSVAGFHIDWWSFDGQFYGDSGAQDAGPHDTSATIRNLIPGESYNFEMTAFTDSDETLPTDKPSAIPLKSGKGDITHSPK